MGVWGTVRRAGRAWSSGQVEQAGGRAWSSGAGRGQVEQAGVRASGQASRHLAQVTSHTLEHTHARTHTHTHRRAVTLRSCLASKDEGGVEVSFACAPLDVLLLLLLPCTLACICSSRSISLRAHTDPRTHSHRPSHSLTQTLALTHADPRTHSLHVHTDPRTHAHARTHAQSHTPCRLSLRAQEATTGSDAPPV